VCDGVSLLTWQSDTFAYAETFDEAVGRYRGLRGGQVVTLDAEDVGLLVKPEMARRQLDAEAPLPAPRLDDNRKPGEKPSDGAAGDSGGMPASSHVLHRFHGSVRLDPARVGRDAGRIAEEVIAHLAGQVGAEVTVTLEIEARLPDGASEQIVRVVTENSRTLKFTSQGFEKE
jgi:hypothetical protein